MVKQLQLASFNRDQRWSFLLYLTKDLVILRLLASMFRIHRTLKESLLFFQLLSNSLSRFFFCWLRYCGTGFLDIPRIWPLVVLIGVVNGTCIVPKGMLTIWPSHKHQVSGGDKHSTTAHECKWVLFTAVQDKPQSRQWQVRWFLLHFCLCD